MMTPEEYAEYDRRRAEQADAMIEMHVSALALARANAAALERIADTLAALVELYQARRP